jgi:hypothetical protein
MGKNPETKVTAKITKALDKIGAIWYKQHGNSMSVSGTPDLLVCYRGRFYGIEVKTEENEADAAQLNQMRRIVEIGGGVSGVCRTPADAITLLGHHIPDTCKIVK